jgi:hypothetical protein
MMDRVYKTAKGVLAIVLGFRVTGGGGTGKCQHILRGQQRSDKVKGDKL